MTLISREYWANSFDELTFSIAFCIGIIKYFAFSNHHAGEESVEMYIAVSQGMLNGIRIILLSSFVPVPLRIFVPFVDIIYTIIRIAAHWKTRKMHICTNAENMIYHEMEHVHVE